MLQKTSSSYWIYSSKKNSKNEAPIYLRISVDGNKTELSTRIKTNPKFWNAVKQRINPNHPEAGTLNAKLESIKKEYNEVLKELLEANVEISEEVIKKRLMGEGEVTLTLMELVGNHNQKLKELVGKDFTPATLQRYTTLQNHLRTFLTKSYKVKDVLLSHLSTKFLLDFEHWLKVENNNSHNSSVKYVKNFFFDGFFNTLVVITLAFEYHVIVGRDGLYPACRRNGYLLQRSKA